MSMAVLLPGLDGTEVFLQPLARALRREMAVTILTYPTSGPQTYEEFLSQIRHDTRGLPSFHVCGWSFGGPLALMLAAAEPDRVRSVTLASSFVHPPSPWLTRLRFALRSPLLWTYRLARRAPLWLRPASDPWRAAKADTWTRVPARIVAARLRLVSTLDARETLHACSAPILYLSAADDRVVSPRSVEVIRERQPTTGHVELPGGHFALYNHPDLAAREIVRFIDACERAPVRAAG